MKIALALNRKMKPKNITQIILIFLVLTAIISATSIEIEMKDSFGIGEEVFFDYTIVSEVSQEIEYITSVDCPNAPLPLLEIKTATLQKNIPLTENYIYLSSVDENIEPQICKAIVSVISPEEILKEKEFEIVSIPSFLFNLISCRDSSCLEKSKVFVKGEDIFLDYESDISDLVFDAVLIYPDGTEKDLEIPSSIKAYKIGTYELKVTASKEGYKTQEKILQFGIIEKEAKIQEADFSEDSEVIYGHRVGAGENNLFNYLIYSLIGIAIIVFIVIVFYLRKEKRKLSSK